MSSFTWSPISSDNEGVISINGLIGALTLAGGTGITVSQTGPSTLTISSTATTGNLTDVGTDGITITGGTGAVNGSGTTISQHVSDTTHNGYLSSTDWNTFNNKQPAGNYITALTGDATATGPGSAALTLATVNSNIGTFASVTVNAKGLVTSAANLSGDATTSGSALTLATVNSNVGSFGSSTAIPSFTVNAKGLITAASTNAVIAPAGTLTGTTLASNVVTSSLTTVGTIGTGTWNGTTIATNHGGTGQTSYTNGQLLIGNTTGNTLAANTLTAGTNITITNGPGTITINATGGGSGSVTSVALADGSTTPIYTVSGSPVTTSGTLTLTLANQSANTVFAGPTTGAATQPTFRGLVSADIPNNAANTTGTASNITATSNSTLTTLTALTSASNLNTVGTITSGTWNGTTIDIGHGGTGQVTKTAAFDALQPMTTLGDIIYGGTSGTGTRLGGNTTTTKEFLSSTGTGSAANTPVWTTLSSADLPTITLTGDVTGSASGGSIATTLATVNANVGTFASVTVNAKGLTTAAANLSGDATTSGSTLTLATVNSNVGTFTNATITVNAKGLVTAASSGTGGSSTALGSAGYASKNTTYVIVSGDNGRVFGADTTGGAFSITLPAASSGFIFTIKDIKGNFGTNNLTLTRVSTESIEGVASNFVMAANWGTWTFMSDGTNWFIIA